MRSDGFAPLHEYAAIGDGRSVALVASDGDVDWLCLPTAASPAAFAALLDPERGGRATLRPVERCETTRAYHPDTNVLETTHRTASGVVRVTDAMTLDAGTPPPWNELARRVECLAGAVELDWSFAPRCDYGRGPPLVERRGDIPVLGLGHAELAVRAWDAGEPDLDGEGVRGRARLRDGERALLAATATADAPVAAPARDEIERRLRWTLEDWRRIAEACTYDGPWREAVRRSALVLHLLIDRANGMMVAAPTTSLPECPGGSRNYDYRFGWVRDCSFALDALMGLGYRAQAHATLAWLLDVTRRTHPRLQPFYDVSGEAHDQEERLGLRGYHDAQPVVAGNDAAGQLQLGCFGDLLDSVARYVQHGNALDPDTARRVAELADYVCEAWRRPDSSIWELPDPRQYTQSKLASWMALDRAIGLASAGAIDARHAGAWRHEAEAIRSYVLGTCWSDARQSLAGQAGTDDLDASVLLAGWQRFLAPEDPRLATTVDAVRRELADGPFVYRTNALRENEGAFVACSLWLVDALARLGRLDEAAEVMDGICAAANDLGLLSEEVDPTSGALLGNFPQALSHLAIANAALTFEQQQAQRRARPATRPASAAAPNASAPR